MFEISNSRCFFLMLFCFEDLSANALSTIRVQRRIIPATFESRTKKLKVDVYLCI